MENNNLNLKALESIFKQYPQVKLIYFFGSKASGKAGPLSDFDFAVLLDEEDTQKRFKIRIKILIKLSEVLKTDNIDLIILNDAKNPELKFSIIKDGKVIYEKEPYKILLEPKILNEYFDFIDGLRRCGLTKNI